MGNRSMIQVESKEFEAPVLMYGHWAGEDNIRVVRKVLTQTNRIGDAGYLTAQIFYEFTTAGAYDGELGFGLYAGTDDQILTDNPTVYVNADDGSYSVEFGEWISNKELRATYEYGTSTAA